MAVFSFRMMVDVLPQTRLTECGNLARICLLKYNMKFVEQLKQNFLQTILCCDCQKCII